MKNLILITVLTAATVQFSTESPVITEASLPTSSMAPDANQRTELFAEAGLFGKPKYNKRKIQRQNSVRKTNRRTKRIHRRNGLAEMPNEMEVNHV